MKILLFGKNGQVGTQFARLAASAHEIVAVDRAACDLGDTGAIRALILSAAPEAIVNAAAYTAVDKAESDRETCFAVNAAAPGVMAETARTLGIPLIHYSTDYVFNGQKQDAYLEDDATGPLGVYGRSKLEGEQRIAAAGGHFLVLRTSWVYGAEGHNFLRTMLRLGAERPELRIVSDQIGAPTSSLAIAEATLRILNVSAKPTGETPVRTTGVFHMTAGGATSWYGFAEKIFALADMQTKPKLIPILTFEYPTPAERPRNSVLANDKFEGAFGFRLANWEPSLEEQMAIRNES